MVDGADTGCAESPISMIRLLYQFDRGLWTKRGQHFVAVERLWFVVRRNLISFSGLVLENGLLYDLKQLRCKVFEFFEHRCFYLCFNVVSLLTKELCSRARIPSWSSPLISLVG